MQPSAPKSTRPAARGLGLLTVLTGLAVNPWSLAWRFSADQYIEAGGALNLIRVTQGAVVLLGLALILGLRLPLSRGLGRIAGVMLLGVTVLGAFGTARALGWIATDQERVRTETLSRMTASETLHLNLSARTKALSASLENLRIPSGAATDLMADAVLVRGLDPDADPRLEVDLASVATRVFEWPLQGTEASVARTELDLLRPFLDHIAWIDHGKFYFIAGDFVGEELGAWEVEVGFAALGKQRDGGWTKAKGHLRIRWELPAGDDPGKRDVFNDYERWRITRIVIDSFKTFETPAIFFSEELDTAVSDPDVVAAVRRNIAQEHIVEKVLLEAKGKTWTPPHAYWGPQAGWRNPAVSVVDLDRDGFDDFYTMARHGQNHFFRNRRDGTFEEISKEIGLDVTDYTDVAIFADFDNDGDDDAFLGRTVERSKFMRNDGGRFVEAPEAFDVDMPYFTTTASGVDYDLDGQLDLYVGTYAAQVLGKYIHEKGAGNLDGKMLGDYLPDHHAEYLLHYFREKRGQRVKDRAGPPNLLMRNAGDGRFMQVEETPLTLYRNTYQSTFADFDSDGDPDVYVANDFAPNYMFRNEGGVFVDITDETDGADVGFGMGASWGDYDKDGDQDLYVSNMYSKAGNRILRMVDQVDRTFLRMAAGNSLLELRDGVFRRVSSLDDSGKRVEMAGWSWGSQWVDIDNDSWLDLYALSGHYSAPREIAAGHDL